MKCDTVKIQAETEQGFKIINKDDFDDSKHKIYSEKKTTTKK